MALQTFTAGQVLTAAQVTALQTNGFNQTVSTKTADHTLVAADKGTRVEMNSATATTITVDTDLFNAGDTLFIQNIGAGVCTITAGTATVSTSGDLALVENAGGTLFFVSAGVAIFYATGVTAAGGGMTLLSTTTLSGASTTISGILQDFQNLEIIAFGLTNSSGNNVLKVRPNGSTTLVHAAGSRNVGGSFITSGISNATIEFNTTTDRDDANNAVKICIENYASTTNFKSLNYVMNFLNTSSARTSEQYAGAIQTNGAITSLVFLNPGGNWASGTVEIYGVS